MFFSCAAGDPDAPFDSGCLPGITREALLEIIPAAGFTFVEQDLVPADLDSADEVFISSTTREVAGVGSIQPKWQYSAPGKVTRELETSVSDLRQSSFAACAGSELLSSRRFCRGGWGFRRPRACVLQRVAPVWRSDLSDRVRSNTSLTLKMESNLLMQEEKNELARDSGTATGRLDSRVAMPEHDLLSEIPSPTRSLWLGLCITLAIFVIFATYTIHEIRWLQDFQVNVVQKNRKASLQLLRLQDDTYQLAVSLRDMTLPESRYPIYYWKGKFSGLHEDMNNGWLWKPNTQPALRPAILCGSNCATFLTISGRSRTKLSIWRTRATRIPRAT